jgi:hypothetical protein
MPMGEIINLDESPSDDIPKMFEKFSQDIKDGKLPDVVGAVVVLKSRTEGMSHLDVFAWGEVKTTSEAYYILSKGGSLLI